MRNVRIEAVNKMKEVFGKFKVELNGHCIDVGGSRRVILDDKESDNPLLDLYPDILFLDKGFQSQLGIDKIADFLDADDIMRFRQTFQVVTCFDTLEHVENPFKWCRHLRYITVTGGYVYLSTVFNFPYHPSPMDYWRFTPAALSLLFDTAAIEVLDSGWEGDRSVYILGRV